MIKRPIFLISALVLIITTAFAPALQDDKYELFIHNNTEDGVTVTLEGPKDFKFALSPGKIEKTLNAGTYDYFIEVDECDIEITGEITVEDNDQELIIPPCEPDFVEPKIVINVHIDQAIAFEMVGPETYTLNLELGTNKFRAIVSGDYFYSYEACDGEIYTGVLDVKKNGTTKFTIRSCERLIYQEFDSINPVRFRIANHYSETLGVTLIGPTTFFFNISPGINRLDVVAGRYQYIFVYDNKRVEGFLTVGKNGNTEIVFSPAFSGIRVTDGALLTD